MDEMTMISRNFGKVREKIADACSRAGKSPDDVLLVAVSKGHPISAIKEVYDLGQRDFGENYLQEALEKTEDLPRDICWHFTGRLQKRKVREIVGRFSYIHSLDSLKHLGEIVARCKRAGVQTQVLIQINFHDEQGKGGVREYDDLFTLVEAALGYDEIVLRGLTLIPPFAPDPEQSRRYFSETREVFELVHGKYMIDSFDMISMGMSDDFEVAIEEGSNCVRIGRAIFGERNRE